MPKKKKRLFFALGLALALAAFCLSPVFPYARSLAVMSVYSPYCAKGSLMAQEGFSLKIPSGKGWYPFVMTYTANEAFSRYSGLDGAKLTILYDFPAFDLKRGCSRLFDASSPYYNSFYGAYLISTQEKTPFGFSDDTPEALAAAVSSVAEFDFFNLVLSDFGLDQNSRGFDFSVTDTQENVPFAGYTGWTRLCSELTVSGASHTADGFKRSYLQYGSPNYPVSAAFAPVKMKSVIYARYFAQWNCSVFFYVMSPDEAVLERCENTLLAKSVLADG